MSIFIIITSMFFSYFKKIQTVEPIISDHEYPIEKYVEQNIQGTIESFISFPVDEIQPTPNKECAETYREKNESEKPCAYTRVVGMFGARQGEQADQDTHHQQASVQVRKLKQPCKSSLSKKPK